MHRTLLLVLLAAACKPKPPTGTDTDADSDADADTDTDTDADSDADADSDTDTDTDTDAGTDSACPVDDVFEPNDSVSTALPITVEPNLVVCGTSPDHWLIDVPPNRALQLDLRFMHAAGDLDLLLIDPFLGVDVAIAQSESDDETLFWVNEDTNPVGLVARVYGYSGMGNTYAMQTTFHSCDADADEPDDTPAQASTATQAGQHTVDDAPDVFLLGTIAPEDALSVQFGTQPLLGEVLLELIDRHEVVLAEQDAASGPLEWNNPTNQAIDVFARFSLLSGFCGKYDFSSEVRSPEPELCADGVDNDLDGWVDCDDYSCIGVAACPAGCSTDDAGEDNDTPDEATSLPEGADLLTHVEDPDWFVLVLASQEYAAVTVDHAPVEDALNLVVRDEHDLLVVQTETDGGDGLLEWFNDSPDTRTYRVGIEVADGGVCTTYGVSYAVGPLPPEVCDDGTDNDLDGGVDCADYDCLDDAACAGVCPHEDGLEPNDSPNEATLAPNGTGLMSHVQDEDYFVLTVPAGAVGTITLQVLTPGADLDLLVTDSAGVFVVESATVNPTESLFWVNRTDADIQYTIRVAPAPGAAPCSGYDIESLVTAIPPEICNDSFDNDLDGFTDCDDYQCLEEIQCVSACPLEDALEDNDVRAEATADANGTNLMVHPQDDDWFVVSLQPGESADLTLSYVASLGNLAMRVEDEDGFVLVDSDEAADLVFARWNNPTPQLRNYFIEMRTSMLGEQCNRYDLTTSVNPPFAEVCTDQFDNDGDGAVDCEDADCIGEEFSCGCATDVFEGNHDHALAALLPGATTANLVVPVQGGDWFETSVDANGVVEVFIGFDPAASTIAAHLYDRSGVWLADAIEESGGARLRWTNTTTTAQPVFLQVELTLGTVNPVCGTYSLEVP